MLLYPWGIDFIIQKKKYYSNSSELGSTGTSARSRHHTTNTDYPVGLTISTTSQFWHF